MKYIFLFQKLKGRIIFNMDNFFRIKKKKILYRWKYSFSAMMIRIKELYYFSPNLLSLKNFKTFRNFKKSYLCIDISFDVTKVIFNLIYFHRIPKNKLKVFFFCLFLFLLSSMYIKRKYWIRKNFRHPVFDEFTCSEMRWTRFDHF